MQFAVAQYQNATNFNVHTINGNGGQRIESVLNNDCFRSQPPEIVANFGKIVTRHVLLGEHRAVTTARLFLGAEPKARSSTDILQRRYVPYWLGEGANEITIER